MADITITCGSCGNQITVSEYVSSDSLVCYNCKTSVPVPKRAPVESSRPKLTVRVDTPPIPSPIAPPPVKKKWRLFGPRTPRQARPAVMSSSQDTIAAKMPKIKKRARQTRYSAWSNKYMPWILFVILTLVLCYLRYIPDAMPAARLAMLIKGAIGALIFIHVTIIVYAFGEDAFTAVLCTIIPGYSVYYLFTQADQYILRALAAALLLAFGPDAGKAITKHWLAFYHTTNAWIQDKKPDK